MVHVPLMFLSEWREFPSASCLKKKKKRSLMRVRVSMLLKSHALPHMLPFSLCNKKRFAIWHMNSPRLSNDTFDSVLRHWDVCRVKDLSALPRKFFSSPVRHQVNRPQQKRLFSVTSIWRIFPHFSTPPPFPYDEGGSLEALVQHHALQIYFRNPNNPTLHKK